MKKLVKCINKSIDIDPNNAHAWNYKGYALFDLKIYEDALKCFDKVYRVR